MHKSIFERLEKNYSNPLDEYIKISSFISEKECFYSDSIYLCFYKLFPYCEPLRKHYSNLSECIQENLGILANYHYGVGNDIYEGFDHEIKEEILDSFLTYIEIISCILCVFKKYYPSVFGSAHINKPNLNQLEEMIDESLRSINYKIEEKNPNNVVIIKSDPISEQVAEQSSPNMKVAFLNYLSIRNGDIKGKEKALHDIIDLLEPDFKKFENTSIINSVKEYAQIIRHPEIKKNQKEYEWFVDNKNLYLDQLFTLCVFTQQYVLSKSIIDSFSEEKKKASQ